MTEGTMTQTHDSWLLRPIINRFPSAKITKTYTKLASVCLQRPVFAWLSWYRVESKLNGSYRSTQLSLQDGMAVRLCIRLSRNLALASFVSLAERGQATANCILPKSYYDRPRRSSEEIVSQWKRFRSHARLPLIYSTPDHSIPTRSVV